MVNCRFINIDLTTTKPTTDIKTDLLNTLKGLVVQRIE